MAGEQRLRLPPVPGFDPAVVLSITDLRHRQLSLADKNVWSWWTLRGLLMQSKGFTWQSQGCYITCRGEQDLTKVRADIAQSNLSLDLCHPILLRHWSSNQSAFAVTTSAQKPGFMVPHVGQTSHSVHVRDRCHLIKHVLPHIAGKALPEDLTWMRWSKQESRLRDGGTAGHPNKVTPNLLPVVNPTWWLCPQHTLWHFHTTCDGSIVFTTSRSKSKSGQMN